MVSDIEIEKAAAAIRAGDVVAFPTETVYGLGADALNPIAVAKIFELKGRPWFDPLIVHVADVAQASGLVAAVPPAASKLIERFWPGPLTLVLPKTGLVPDLVTSGLATVAIRLPEHPTAQRLIRAAQTPLAAPSANRFGGVSPTTAQHVRDEFGAAALQILDDGPCSVGVESTVLGMANGVATLLRPGGVPLEEIEAVIGPVAISTGDSAQPAAPGQLLRHYAPTTRLMILEHAQPPGANERVGLLSFQRPRHGEPFAAVEVLSERGDLREAAANLFAAMRRLDSLQLDRIIALSLPEIGLGRAIMDRLRRASH